MITLQERVHSASPPESWSLNKLHRVFRVRKGNKNVGMQEANLLSLSYGRIIQKNIDTAEGLLPESFETYQIVEPGNIVMRLTDLQNDKRSLRQGIVNQRGIITSAYDALELEKGHDPRFWAYALLALDLAKYYYSLGGGVRQSIKFSDFPNDWIASPAAKTQKTIADFLDRETARIDQLIEKKERLLSVLRERQSVSARRLLSGEAVESHDRLTADTPWLSAVPIHWELVPLRRLVKISTGGRDTQDRVDDGPYPFYVRSMNVEKIDTFSYDTEAVLTSGDGAGVGKVFHHVNGRFELHQRMYAFTEFKRMSGLYFFYFLKSFFYLQMTQWSAKSTVDSVRMPFLKSMVFAVPPRSEQEILLRKIDESFQRTEKLANEIRRSNNRLREFRSALITAAVTGQIDVANWSRRGSTDRRLDQIEEEMSA